jgi:hypothetical protein
MSKVTRSLKDKIKMFRNQRITKDELEESIKKGQPELIAALQEVGASNEVGVVYDPDDEHKGAAYVQQNTPSEYWNDEAILDWLSKPVRGRKTLRLACTTRILDLKKFEAEVAAGNVPPKVAAKFKMTGNRPAPFIRFGKINDKSLS